MGKLDALRGSLHGVRMAVVQVTGEAARASPAARSVQERQQFDQRNQEPFGPVLESREGLDELCAILRCGPPVPKEAAKR